MNVAGVWWVEKDDVERWTVTQRLDRVKNGRADNSIALRDPAVGHVLRDQRPRAPVVFHERHLASAPADGLDAHGTGPRVAVEHPRTRHGRRQKIEERLAPLVGRRAQPSPRGGPEAAALQGACDHPHTLDVPIWRLSDLVISIKSPNHQIGELSNLYEPEPLFPCR